VTTEAYVKEDIRKTRIPVEYKATYTLGDISGEAFFTDISEDGIALRVRQVFAIGDILTIQSRISDNLTLDFIGEVRNINGNVVGIIIKEIDPYIQTRFMEHVNSLLRMASRGSTEEFKRVVDQIKKRG
jgi:hypothetical protein